MTVSPQGRLSWKGSTLMLFLDFYRKPKEISPSRSSGEDDSQVSPTLSPSLFFRALYTRLAI